MYQPGGRDIEIHLTGMKYKRFPHIRKLKKLEACSRSRFLRYSPTRLPRTVCGMNNPESIASMRQIQYSVSKD